MEKRILQARIEKLVVGMSGLVFMAAFGWAQATPVRIPPNNTVASPSKSETTAAAVKGESRTANRVVINEAGIQYEIPAGWRTE